MAGSRTLCCQISTTTIAFALVYLMGNVLKLVIIIHSAAFENAGFSGEPKAFRSLKALDLGTVIMTLLIMSVSSVLVFFSQRKGHVFVLPFLMTIAIDLGLSFVSLLNGLLGLAGTPQYKETLLAFKSHVKVDQLSEEDLGFFTSSYTILFIVDLMLRVYAFNVSMRYYYELKERSSTTAVNVETGKVVSGHLPSYDEAIKVKV